ncbi:MAG: VCBS repeat-containing protein, partial [Candidatus Electrothrix sp. AUS4]|nr:VCBS repeat-containing protein [Candidatus Electrothrix sp. AUS4]
FYSLKRQRDGVLMKGQRLTLPPGFNIYDFILVDLDQDGTLEFVGITRGNKLTVIDKNGKTLWKSEKSFGASREILGTLSSTVDGDRNPANNPQPLYMHTRLIAQDLNGDGKAEIILGRNRLAETTFFRRLRSFEGSSITALAWSDGAMKTMWESPKFPGYTVDFQISQAAPGQFRLVSLEQEHSNNLVSFLSRKEARVHTFILGRNDHAVTP